MKGISGIPEFSFLLFFIFLINKNNPTKKKVKKYAANINSACFRYNPYMKAIFISPPPRPCLPVITKNIYAIIYKGADIVIEPINAPNILLLYMATISPAISPRITILFVIFNSLISSYDANAPVKINGIIFITPF